jgi:hypothetical protein
MKLAHETQYLVGQCVKLFSGTEYLLILGTKAFRQKILVQKNAQIMRVNKTKCIKLMQPQIA